MGTHPIFESDFDCLTDCIRMPVAVNYDTQTEDLNTNLYPGAKFTGEQKSNKQKYMVEVQIDYINWEQSYICGCLNIFGLTETDPSITTFFNGEIIGNSFPFLTRKHQGPGRRTMTRKHQGTVRKRKFMKTKHQRRGRKKTFMTTRHQRQGRRQKGKFWEKKDPKRAGRR